MNTLASMAGFGPSEDAIGRHLIVEFHGATNLEDADSIAEELAAAARSSGGALLGVKLHKLNDNGGIVGVALLPEAHINIHTWPDRRYAAIDVFMCSGTEPQVCIDHLRSFFEPEQESIFEVERGERIAMPVVPS
ncbi:adenosylmethionine decarboxylase [Aestuariibius sp. 2305UL40-4]|uniref:adenosylmethionine decarboxylase n=1 Tax=Aestuariibius violaceus TaxID=3234132 RepID=UPI00345E2EA1